MEPEPDYLVVTDSQTDATIAVETSDKKFALRIAWHEWHGDTPQDLALVARFTIRPAWRRMHPQLTAKLH